MFIPNYGFTNTVYWVGFNVKNISNCRWIIETGYANMHYIDYYSFSDTGNQLKQTGLLRPVDFRDMKFHRFVFKPDLSTGDDTTIYMKFKNEGAMTISLFIRSDEDSFYHKNLEEHIVWGVFYGIILIMIFYNLFLYITLGDNAYIFYVTALFFALLQHLSFNCPTTRRSSLKILHHFLIFQLTAIFVSLYFPKTLK